MNTQKEIRPLMDKIVEIIRTNSFVSEYQDKATAEECIGLAVARYFDWDSRIFATCSAALTDANFHQEAEKVDDMVHKLNS